MSFFLWDIFKNSAESDQNAASGQVFQCLLTECSIIIGIELKNTTQHSLKQKWTGAIDKNGKFHSA